MIKDSSGKVIVGKSRLCKDFFSKSIGLMFSLPKKDFGLIFAFKDERIIGLHMWFVFYPIDVVFLDRQKKVVDILENFRPFTFASSKTRAMYAVELPAGTVAGKVKPGQKLEF